MWWKKKNTKVFGVSVEEAAKKSVLKNGIPLPLTRCVDTIEREALTIEGVYRRTGDLSDVDRIIKLYDLGKDPDLLPYDPFVLTSLLKKYFTLLPEPITTFELYTQFIAAKKRKEKADKVKGVRELVQKLPEINRFVLYFIMQHLVRVSKYSSENKMSTTNLSIVFGPTLFRSTDNSSTRLLADAGHLGGCVEIMISNFDRVFDFLLPNLQISVKEDEEMIKLMNGAPDTNRNRSAESNRNRSAESNRNRSVTSYVPIKLQDDQKNSESKNDGVIELRRDRRRIMSTRVGLNFVELSAQFGGQEKHANKGLVFDVKKPSEMINIPLPAPKGFSTAHLEDDKDRKRKYTKSHRYTASKNQVMRPNFETEEDKKTDEDKNQDEEELLLLKSGKGTSELTFDATEDVNNVLSDIINNSLLEQTSTPTLVLQANKELPDVTNAEESNEWKRQRYDNQPSTSVIEASDSFFTIESSADSQDFKDEGISELDIRNVRRVPSFYEVDFHEIDEETFHKELMSIDIDLDRPLMGVTARINLIKVRLGLLTDNDEDSVQNLSNKELTTERKLLKSELARFDRLWERERKRTIDRNAKQPLKPLYERYNRVCEILKEKKIEDDIPNPIRPSHRVLSIDTTNKSDGFISPKSPLFTTHLHRTASIDERHEELASLIRSKNKPSTPSSFVDTTFRTTTFVARNNTNSQLVSPLSPEDEKEGLRSARAEMIAQKLQASENYLLTKKQKDELKRKLHQFQEDFIRQNGRKINNKSDRKPVEKEFEEYKRLKRILKENEREVEREVDKIMASNANGVISV